MALTLDARATGTVDAEERYKIEWQAEIENARRAALDPPLPPLPVTTNAERKTAWEAIATQTLKQWDESIQQQANDRQPDRLEARQKLKNASDQKLVRIIAILDEPE